MGKVEKLSPSPTYPRSGSKRTKVILEAVRRTDENAIRQHASESAAMKMDETIETNRETSETDEKCQTFNNQRSHKIRKRVEFIYTSLSVTTTEEINQPFLNMPLRNRLQVDPRHILKEEEKERTYRRSNWNSTLTRNQLKFKYSTIGWMWMQFLIQCVINHDIYIHTK